jgi:transcriptional regulator with XRE-family HTH domain
MFVFLREIYPHKTMEHVAADLGVSVETVAKWRSRKSLPEALTCLRMMFIYGHDFFKCVAPEMARQLNERIARDQRTLNALTDL